MKMKIASLEFTIERLREELDKMKSETRELKEELRNEEEKRLEIMGLKRALERAET